MKRLLYIMYFLEVGLVLVLVPWSRFWDGNYFAYGFPVLRDLLGNHFVRGGVSGLGIVNLCVGFVDLGALVFMRRLDSGVSARILSRDDSSIE